MGELNLLRFMLQIAVRETQEGSARADSILSWCGFYGAFLSLPDLSKADGKARKKKAKKARKGRKSKTKLSPWERLRAALAKPSGKGEDRPSASLMIAKRLAAMLALTPEDARLLQVAVAFNRLRRVSALAYRLRTNGYDLVMLAAELAGLESADDVVRSANIRLGLIELQSNRAGEVSLDLTTALDRPLEQGPVSDDGLIECLVGPRATASLSLTDFADRAKTVDLMRRILAGALERRAAGVNILLYGPPGTGKTELAKAVAAAAGSELFAVGEADDYGDEPNRWDRVTSLKLAQRVLANRPDTALLFDEMEDLIGEAERTDGGTFARREGSKVFVNRLFESNPVPTLWTSNTIENVDPAYLRRMSFVLKMDIPSAVTRRRILGRIAETEGLKFSEAAASRLTDMAPEAVAVARKAIQTARLAGGHDVEAGAVAEALVCGLRHGRRSSAGTAAPRALDLNLYHASRPIDGLFNRLSRPDAPLDFSLLLMGPPGTGKTALAHHLARTLDRPLEVKRASDLLSKWIGETERKIADSFAAASERGHVLLFDEIDSLLFDRATATRSWEVSQVNELLTWMDRHPMPFIAATNHASKLDPATMRRFVFKVELKPLPSGKAAHAYRHFFGGEPPRSLAEIDGLTPGDFAVVARQLRFDPEARSPKTIVRLLAAEASARPCRLGRIGFHGAHN